jgi:hypothetical protein
VSISVTDRNPSRKKRWRCFEVFHAHREGPLSRCLSALTTAATASYYVVSVTNADGHFIAQDSGDAEDKDEADNESESESDWEAELNLSDNETGLSVR